MRSRHGRPRTAPQMGNRSFRREQDPPAARADGRADVDILGVEEVAFVEEPNRLQIRPVDQQRRAAHPVHIALAARLGHDPAFHPAHAPLVQAHPPFLAELGQRRDHRTERQLGAAMAVHQSRAGRRGGGMCGQPRQQRIHGSGRDHTVTVQEQKHLPLRAPDAHVVRRGEAGVPLLFDHLHRWPSRPHRGGAAVARRVVDHDDVVGN